MEIKILTDRPGVYNMVSTFETCKVTHTFLLWLMISVEIYLERKKMVAGIHGSFTLYAGEVLEVSVTPTAGRGTPPWGIFSEGKNWAVLFDASSCCYTLGRFFRLEPTTKSPMKRKENDLFQTSRELCSMLIFRGVCKSSCNQPKICRIYYFCRHIAVTFFCSFFQKPLKKENRWIVRMVLNGTLCFFFRGE